MKTDGNPLTEFRADPPAPTAEYLARTRAALLSGTADPSRPALRTRIGTLTRTRLRLRIAVAGATAVTATAGLVSVTLVGATPASASDLLSRAASAAAAEPNPVVHPGQFSYIQTLQCHSRMTTAEWLPLDGKGVGLIRRSGLPGGPQDTKTIDHQWEGVGPGVEGTRSADPSTDPDLFFPTYDFLLSLPTDPAALLAVVDKEATAISTDRDGEAFWIISHGATSAYVPPQVRANLLRAAALIPGTKIVKNVKDCAGRPGTAVSRDSDGGGGGLVFDAGYRLLGLGVGSKGIGGWAVTGGGIVDAIGQVP